MKEGLIRMWNYLSLAILIAETLYGETMKFSLTSIKKKEL